MASLPEPEALAEGTNPGRLLPELRARRLRRALWVGGASVGVCSAAALAWIWLSPSAHEAGADPVETHPAVMRPMGQASVAEQPGLPKLAEAPSAGSLRARAKQLLISQMTSGARSLRTEAAIALAGDGDAAARAALAEVLAGPASLERLDAAAALAGAGDARGSSALEAALVDPRRDLRLEAARQLARLGRPSGSRVLGDALAEHGQGLSAAEALASLGDRKALELLHKTLTGKDLELRMRAAVALGHLGDPAAEPVLASVLGDSRFQVGAAAALADLGHDVSHELVAALAYTALRHDAARALSRHPALPEALSLLAADLDSGDAHARLSAAEALLVLVPGGTR